MYQNSRTGVNVEIRTPQYSVDRSQAGQIILLLCFLFLFDLFCLGFDLFFFTQPFLLEVCVCLPLPSQLSFVNIHVKDHRLQEILSFRGMSLGPTSLVLTLSDTGPPRAVNHYRAWHSLQRNEERCSQAGSGQFWLRLKTWYLKAIDP